MRGMRRLAERELRLVLLWITLPRPASINARGPASDLYTEMFVESI